ncbi:MAG: bifunctional hydroxymethylpyrimidine kinase/phosphomethylpyrimidine kinase [Myxococcota bacterium]|nr:bifunctional hydroxymethylpyrimidine kinase/phosphomethylpyrimidine kinase [Myxococcota bacterium]
MKKSIALSIAGSDTSCGAGIQVDLRMFSACGVFGTTVLTALTAQNPYEVTAVHGLPADFVRAQVDAILTRLPVTAIKTGMLWSPEIIDVVVETAKRYPHIPIVVDPVMIATSGAKLISDDAIEKYKRDLLPLCALATPNADEAKALLESQTITKKTQRLSAKAFFEQYGCPILLKGGHLEGDPIDLLYDGKTFQDWVHPRIQTVNTHGSGCMLSAAITAELAKSRSLGEAVSLGLDRIHEVLSHPVSLTADLELANVEYLSSAST